MSVVDRARALRPVIERNAETMTDEAALESPELFPAWSGNGAHYIAGQRVRYMDVLYKVLQDHTSLPDWTPDVVGSLYAKVLIPDPEVIPQWEQPDSTNPYMLGDVVMHNDLMWVSLVDNNVWEPGAVGTESLWEQVVETE